MPFFGRTGRGFFSIPRQTQICSRFLRNCNFVEIRLFSIRPQENLRDTKYLPGSHVMGKHKCDLCWFNNPLLTSRVRILFLPILLCKYILEYVCVCLKLSHTHAYGHIYIKHRHIHYKLHIRIRRCGIIPTTHLCCLII